MRRRRRNHVEMRRCKGSRRLEKLGKLSTGGMRVFEHLRGRPHSTCECSV